MQLRYESLLPKQIDWSRIEASWCILADGKFPGTAPLSAARGLRVPAVETNTRRAIERQFLPVPFVKQSLRKRNEKL